MKTKLIFYIIAFCYIFKFYGCSNLEIVNNNEPTLPDITVEQLLGYPDTILIEGRQVYLSTYMWRDFMPISPPDGKPLIALMYITAVDTIPIPSGITSDAIWIVYNNQVWKSRFSDEQLPPPISPNIFQKIAREGPKWGPCTDCVSVVIRIYDTNRNEYFLKAGDQNISRTD